MLAHHDFEGGNALDLRDVGVYRWAEHPSNRIWVMSWTVGPVSGRWRPGDPDPHPLLDHIRSGGMVGVHNASFERTMWNNYIRRVLCPHWPELRAEQQDCTMARAAALALPQSLEMIGEVLKAPVQKDMEGNALMKKMAKPRKVHDDGRIEWWDTVENLARVGAYCDTDVAAETAIGEKLMALSAEERDVWLLDQRINDRGIRIDVPLVHRMIAVREIAKARLNKEMQAVTNGTVGKCTQTSELANWIRAQGFACESVAKDQLILLSAQADAAGAAHVAHAIHLRQEAAKTGLGKLDAMLECVCADGRVRGLLRYHGASTGRWAGLLLQPQNFERVDHDKDGVMVEHAIAWVSSLPPAVADEWINLSLGPTLSVLAKCLRSMIAAALGKTLRGMDLANIEGRLQAWFGGEQWKLDAFRAYDEKRGPDLYCVAYGSAFNEDPIEVKKQNAKRQIGKVMELALGYQGSVGSFISMGKNYGLKPADLVPVIMSVAPDRFASWCDRYKGARDKHGLPMDQWAAIKVIVTGWRTAHAGIEAAWYEIQDAAVQAVANPNTPVYAMDGKVAYLSTRNFLWCRLPSGRVLAYANPYLKTVHEQWIILHDGHRVDREDVDAATWQIYVDAGLKVHDRYRRQVNYEAWDSERKRWTVFALYGGMQFNHIVQGTARDVLVGGMLRAEMMGYTIVLTVHDEVLTEDTIGFGSVPELEMLLTMGETWLPGCPLAAKGWEGDRYAK